MDNSNSFIKPLLTWGSLILAASFIGLAAYTVYVSRAHSYLSDDPKTCVNCHIMAPQFATWNHSSHREHATCNDCHVPHENAVRKWLFKAKDGLRHATIFTMRGEPQVIQIHQEGADVVQANCLRCHEDLNRNVDTQFHPEHHSESSEKKCWDCHREVPHGRVNSLSSTPKAKVPLPESPVPNWLKKELSNQR